MESARVSEIGVRGRNQRIQNWNVNENEREMGCAGMCVPWHS